MSPRLQRACAPAALVVSVLALLSSFTGLSDAAKRALSGRASTKPKPFGILRLDKHKRYPASVIPKVRAAKRADTIGGMKAAELQQSCTVEASVDLGTWCLDTSPQPVTNEQAGKNDYFFASQSCVEQGGYLPTAAQLIGAAARVKLASTIGDSQLTASTDLDPSDGLRDRREMSATLVTTAAGSGAAGSQGVSDGSKGDPKQNEPDPAPVPANSTPQTLQYVTVYDNGDKGGFAGSKPISQPENYRCAYHKVQAAPADAGSG